MIKYKKEQQVLDIAGLSIGGQPGQWPTVMCGSIFYDGHKIVKDGIEGLFDEGAARELLGQEAVLAEQFGLQRMPDVVGDTPKALIRYVEFVLGLVAGPILVDSASMRTLIETFEYFKGSEVMDRLVLSPIDGHTQPDQFDAIKACGVKHALMMVFSPTAVTPEQKLELLLGADWQTALDSDTNGDGLLAKTKAADIENILVDVGVIDMMGTAWSALSIAEINQKLGLPTGCAPANALFSWQRTHRDTLKNPVQTAAAGAAAYSAPIYQGADFLLYGPISCAEWAYPACAVSDALMAYGNRLNGVKPKSKIHPLYKLK